MCTVLSFAAPAPPQALHELHVDVDVSGVVKALRRVAAVAGGVGRSSVSSNESCGYVLEFSTADIRDHAYGVIVLVFVHLPVLGAVVGGAAGDVRYYT